jgi:hypothetical protein
MFLALSVQFLAPYQDSSDSFGVFFQGTAFVTSTSENSIRLPADPRFLHAANSSASCLGKLATNILVDTRLMIERRSRQFEA